MGVSERSGDASSRRIGVVLSVVSASGGAGKSSVAMAVARQCCNRGLSVLLLDGNCQFGGCSRMTGDEAPLSFSQLLRACETGEGVAAEGLTVVGPDAMEYAEQHIPHLPYVARQAAQWFDVVVVDTSGVWTEPLLSLMEASHRVLFVVGQSSSSVMGARRALDLCLRCSVATGSFLFVLNRCSRHSLFTSIDVSCALGGAHVVEMLEGGAVVEELQGCGLAERLLQDGNPFYKSAAAIAEEAVPRCQGAQEERPPAALRDGRRMGFMASRRRNDAAKRGKHQLAAQEGALRAEEALWR